MDIILSDGLAFSLPLFIMAIGGIYCERSGIINLALEGFQGFGAFVGAMVVTVIKVSTELSPSQEIFIALIAAMFGGMLISSLHALLCIKFKSNHVISGVIINIVATAITTFFTSVFTDSVLGNRSNKIMLTVAPKTTIPGISKIPIIGGLFKDMYTFEIIIIIVAIIAWYVLVKTKFGLRLRACGENPHAVEAAGVKVQPLQMKAVLISGALSGVGGMCFAYSVLSNFSPSIYMGYGYLAISAMIFGSWNIVPTLFACLIFGFTRSAGYQLVLKLSLSSNYNNLVMTLPYVLTLILLIFFAKHSCPPKASGEIYDKGRR